MPIAGNAALVKSYCRSISHRLAERGHRNRAGHPYHASAVKRMVERTVAAHPELRAAVAPAADTERHERLAAVIAGVAA